MNRPVGARLRLAFRGFEASLFDFPLRTIQSVRETEGATAVTQLTSLTAEPGRQYGPARLPLWHGGSR